MKIMLYIAQNIFHSYGKTKKKKKRERNFSELLL